MYPKQRGRRHSHTHAPVEHPVRHECCRHAVHGRVFTDEASLAVAKDDELQRFVIPAVVGASMQQRLGHIGVARRAGIVQAHSKGALFNLAQAGFVRRMRTHQALVVLHAQHNG